MEHGVQASRVDNGVLELCVYIMYRDVGVTGRFVDVHERRFD